MIGLGNMGRLMAAHFLGAGFPVISFDASETQEAVGLTDGRVLIDRLIARMREGRTVIPGASVVERMAAGAMRTADLKLINAVDALLSDELRSLLDAILSEKEHAMLSRLSTLCARPSRPTS